MSSVDERVVELQFNNGQFEQGVQKSLGTLDRLKQGLNLQASAESLNGLKSAGKSFSLANVASNVQSVAERFSNLGIIGDQVLRNLTNSAINMGRSILTAIPNQIVSGGKKRAQNIKQAQFMLEGLMKENFDWETISKDINFAVNETAYGFDEAAKVASQLAASNVEFGEKMQHALRGVSGVAAMTNDSYENIGRIFAQVAGQGRLMGDQLLQISSRGLNAAAVLGEAMGKTEAEIRDMTSKGKISFQEFADAMYNAFGEQATKAEETFNGALSNVKASLSRMGAQFATPAYEQLRRTLLAIKQVFKDIEKLIVPISDKFAELSEQVANFSIGVLGDLHKSLLEVIEGSTKTAAKKVSTTTKEVKKDEEELDKVAEDVIKGIYGTGEARKKALTEAGYDYDTVQNKVNELMGAEKKHSEESKKNAEEEKEVTEELTESQKRFLDKSREINENLDLVETRSDKIGNIFRGLVDGIKLIASFGKTLYDVVIAPFVNSSASAAISIGDRILDFLSKVGKEISKVRAFFEVNDGSMESFVTKLIEPIQKFVTMVSGLENVQKLIFGIKELGKSISDFAVEKIKAIKEGFEGLTDGQIFGVDTLRVVLRTINAIAGAFNSIGSGISNFVTWIAKVVGYVKGLSGVNRFVNDLQDLGSVLKTFVVDKFTEFLEKLNNTSFDGFGHGIDILRLFLRAVNAVTNGLSALIEDLLSGEGAVSKFLKSVKDNVSGIVGSIGKGATSFLSWIGKIAGYIKGLSGVNHLIQSLKQLGSVLKDFAAEAFTKLLEKLGNTSFKGFGHGTDILRLFLRTINFIADSIANLIDDLISGEGTVSKFLAPFKELAKGGFKALPGIFKSIVSALKTFLSGGLKNIEKGDGIVGFLSGLAKTVLSSSGGIVKGITAIGKAISKAFGGFNLKNILTLLNSGIFTAFLLNLRGIVSGNNIAIKKFKTLFTYLPQISGLLTDFQKNLKAHTILAIAGAIGILVLSLIGLTTIDHDKLADGISGLGLLFVELFGAITIFNKLNGGTDITNSGINKIGVAMIEIAIAVSLLAGALKKVAVLSWDEIGRGLAGIAGSMMVLIIAVKAMDTETKGLGKAAAGMILLSVAVRVLVKAVKSLSELSWEELAKGLTGVLGILGSLALFTSLVGGTKGMVSIGVGVLLISAAMKSLTAAVSSMGQMSWEELARGLTGVVGVLISMAAAISLLPKTGMISAGVGMIAMAVALNLVSSAMSKFAAMDIGDIGKALFAIAVALLAIGAAMLIMDGGLAGAAGILVVSIALNALVPVLKALGSLSLKEIGKALLALAGTFVVLGLASLVLAPLAPILLILAGSIALIGIAALACGVGVAALAAGLLLLSTAGAAVGQGFSDALGAIVTALADNTSAIVDSLAQLALSVLGAFQDVIPALIDTVFVLINSLLDGVLEHMDISAKVVLIIVELMNTLADNAELIVDAGINLAISLINGLAKGIRENGEEFLHALNSLIASVGEFFMMILANLIRDVPVIGEKIANALDEAREGSAKMWSEEEGERIGEEFSEGIEQGVEGAGSTITEEMKAAGLESKEAFLASFGDMAQLYKDQGFYIDEVVAETILANMNVPIEALQALGIAGVEELVEIFGGVGEQVDFGLDESDAQKEVSSLVKDTNSELKKGGKELEASAKQTGEKVEKNYGEGLSSLSEMTSNIFGEVNKTAEESGGELTDTMGALGIDSKERLMETFGEIAGGMSDVGVNIDEGVAQGILDNLGVSEDAMHELGVSSVEELMDSLGINSPSRVTKEIGVNTVEGMTIGILSRVSSVRTAFLLMTLAGLDALASKLGAYRTTGSDLAMAFVNGINSEKSSAKSAGSSLASEAQDGVESFKHSKIVDSGEYFAEGWIQGIKNKYDAARKAGAKLVTETHSSVQSTDGEGSPAKMTIISGGFFGEGWIVGIKKTYKAAKAAGSDLVTETATGLGSTMSQIQSIIDSDMQPTIRPVLDLSDVQNGVKGINGMMPNTAIGLSAVSAGVNRRNLSSNDDVIAAINALGKDISNMSGDTYNLGSVTYDDGSNVATAVRGLIRAARMERRR